MKEMKKFRSSPNPLMRRDDVETGGRHHAAPVLVSEH